MKSSCDSVADTPQGKETRPVGVLLEWGILLIRKLEKGRSLNHCSLEEGDWCWMQGAGWVMTKVVHREGAEMRATEGSKEHQ